MFNANRFKNKFSNNAICFVTPLHKALNRIINIENALLKMNN